MASIKQENIGAQHEKITIHLSCEDYLPSFEKALKQYAKNANIPGFRKGTVPIGMVRKQYGQSIFTDEVLRLAGTKLEEHLVASKAEIFARPIPSASQEQLKFDINNPTDFHFEFEIGTRPQFNIPLLDGAQNMPFHVVTVSDEMVNDELERLQYKAGNMTDPETVTGPDNVVNVVFTEVDANGAVVEGGITKDNSMLVKYFTPGLQEQLMGKKTGDSLVFTLDSTFDEKVLPAILRDLDLDPKDPAARQRRFEMKITKVGLVEKAELNEEFFEKIYPGRGITTLEQFKDELRAEIGQYWKVQSRNRLHNELFERLVHETPIELPVQFLKRWMSVGGDTFKSPDVVDREFGGFEHQLRWQLISDKLMEESGINVSREEMEQAARAQVLSYFGGNMNMLGDDQEWMDGFVRKQLADRKFSDELVNRIMTDKLFALIESRVNLQETEVSLDEFSKLPTAHHHHH